MVTKQNIELKANYSDLNKANQILQTISAEFRWEDEQIDTYFNVSNGRFKLRQSKIEGDELIWYYRPNISESKISNYQVYSIHDSSTLKNILASCLGIKMVVDKYRKLYLWNRVRIHLDEVKNLGYFIEFEAPVDRLDSAEMARDKVTALIKEFAIKDNEIQAFGYLDLLLKKQM